MKHFLIYLTVFSLGLLAYYIYDQRGLQCGDQYKFINTIFACSDEHTLDKKDYVDLKVRLLDYISEAKARGKAQFVSVYFRDLLAGPTMGIDERVDYIPASLLKVPLVLTYLAFAEDHPNFLDQKVVFTSEVAQIVPDQTYKSKNVFVAGEAYTLKFLLESTIKNSDNIAAQLLFNNLQNMGDGKLLEQTYRDLGILEMGADLEKEVVNAKSYGSILRTLYNVSFLNPEYSEYLLELLSESKFTDGLRRGVSPDMVVAHKFGERFLKNGDKQLHDCGIVYFPNNPYLLCVMTKGKDFNELSKIISYISQEVYKEFGSRVID